MQCLFFPLRCHSYFVPTRLWSSLLCCTLALWVGFAATTARAGGLEVGDTGAEALGRGGAFVAKADSPAAINYNPAGFAKLKGHQIVLSGHVLHYSYRFERLNSFAVNTQQPWFGAPTHVMASTDFGLNKGFTVGLGFYTPSSTGRNFPLSLGDGNKVKIPAPQRYDTTSVSGLVLYPALVMAYRLAPWIDIGASFQGWVLSTNTQTIATVGAACDTPEDPACDVEVKIQVGDRFSPTGSVGVLLRPYPQFEMGVMLRFPSHAEATGQAQVTFGPGVRRLEGAMRYPMLTPTTPSATLQMSNPMMVRTGARWRFLEGGREVGDIEVNIMFENWSAASTRTVTLQAQSLNQPMKPTIIDWKMKDTLSVRVGGAYQWPIADRANFTLRAGMFGETETTAISDTSLSIYGPRRLGITLGLGLRWHWLQFDVAYAHVFFPRRIVNNSTVRASDFSGLGEGPVVGNGQYDGSVDFISFQCTMRFGQPAPTAPAKAVSQQLNMRRQGQ